MIGIQWATLRKERQQPTQIRKEESKTACTVEDALPASRVCITSSTKFNTRINGRVHANTTDSSLNCIDPVA